MGNQSSSIIITKASYGDNCKNVSGNTVDPNNRDIMAFVKGACDKKTNCVIDTNMAPFIIDPARGCEKKVIINYNCVPSGKSESLMTDEKGVFNISCAANSSSTARPRGSGPVLPGEPGNARVMDLAAGSNLNIRCAPPQTTPVTETFISVGPDGRVYKMYPPCPDGGPLTASTVPVIPHYRKKCPYYWECRPTASCPNEVQNAFYTIDGKFQIYT